MDYLFSFGNCFSIVVSFLLLCSVHGYHRTIVTMIVLMMTLLKIFGRGINNLGSKIDKNDKAVEVKRLVL